MSISTERASQPDRHAHGAMFVMQPPWWVSLLLRAPTVLYRLRAGWVLGHRFLQLTHRGRRTGRHYTTVLEVARYDARAHESVVVSGWGEHADWYRNIQAHPPLEVQTGRVRYVPVWRELAPDEPFDVVNNYMRRLPAPVRPLARRLGLDVLGTDAERREQAARLLMVGFRPMPNPGDLASSRRRQAK